MRHLLVLLPLAFVATAPLAAAEPVAVPAFRSVELRGGGNVVVRPGPASVAIIRGSAAFTEFRVDSQGQLKIDACNERCPHNYDLDIEIHYPTVLPMAVKGGGEISASGFGLQHEVAAGVSGGGTIDLRSVRAETVAAGVNGGGTIIVGASNSLAAAVNGGGEIRYAGNPQVTTAIRGGGTVERSE